MGHTESVGIKKQQGKNSTSLRSRRTPPPVLASVSAALIGLLYASTLYETLSTVEKNTSKYTPKHREVADAPRLEALFLLLWSSQELRYL